MLRRAGTGVGSRWQAVARRVKYIELVGRPDGFETLQSDGHIAVVEQRVMERAQAEALAVRQAGVAEPAQDLQLADLVGNRLTRFRRKEGRLFAGSGQVHRDLAG